MANVYNKGKFELSEGGSVDWSADNIYLALVTSTYTYSVDHNYFNEITNEITNTGYTAGGQQLDSCTGPTEDDTNDLVKFTSSNETFSSLQSGDQPYAAVIYKDTGASTTSPLLAYCVLTTPPAPNGGDYTINCPTNGWIQLTDS